MTYKKTTAILIVASIVLVGVLAIAGYGIVRAVTGISIDEDIAYPVVFVKDGDTFDVQIGRAIVTIRMLGIDTPETVDPRTKEQCYGRESSEETKRLLKGKSVRLKLNPKREETDRYGRYLAFVYVDDIFVNEWLIEHGFAREYTFGKAYMYQQDFKSLEAYARGKRKGLWGACAAPEYKLPRLL